MKNILSSILAFFRSYTFLLCINCIIILIMADITHASNLLVLKDTQDMYPLGGYIEIFEDPSGRLSLKDITSKQYASQFKPSEANVPNFGYTKSAYWVRFRCRNDAAQTINQWILELSFHNMHHIDFYYPNAEGNYNLIRTGNMSPVNSRDVDSIRYAFKLDLPDRSVKTFYMRFQNDASMTIPLTIWTMEAFYKNGLGERFFLGMLMGILLIMWGYNLFIYISLKDESYLYYSLALLFTFFFMLSFTGLAYKYVWPRLVWWNSKSVLIFNALALMAFLKFVDAFLNMDTRLPKCHIITNVFLVFLSFQLLLIPVISYRLLIIPVLYEQALILFLVIIIGVLSLKQGYRPARYFFLSTMFFLVTGSFRAFVRLGWIPSNWFTEYGYTVGIAVGVWMLSLALADRINILKSESEKANFDLSEKEKRYRSIFENIQDVYFETNLDGIIMEVSPSIEQNTQYKRHELIGKDISTIFVDDAQRKQLFSDILRNGKISNFELSLKEKDGSMHFVSTISILLRDDQGNPLKIVGSLRDISEKKLLEDKLLQVEKMESISTLAGGIAHDFSNLLTAINGYAELGVMEHDESHSCNRFFRLIIATGQRASNLTRQLLTFSRKQIIEPRTININTVITDLNKMLSRLIEEDIHIDTQLKPNILKIKADTAQIEQILINLVVNARDAIRQKTEAVEKRIIIQTREIHIDDSNILEHPDGYKGTYVVLSVVDSGVGIEEISKNRIFEPFFTTKEKGKGTGLGLSTIYGIVKQNNGSIDVVSEVGKGSTFRVFWPAFDEEVFRERKKVAPKNEFFGSENILLVEDDNGARDFTSKVLKRYGYTVFEASNGESALTMIQDKNIHVDMLITDFIMPGMNGMELGRAVEKIFPDIKILFTSGYPDEQIFHNDVLEEGINFIQKPFSLIAFVQKVKDVLKGQS